MPLEDCQFIPQPNEKMLRLCETTQAAYILRKTHTQGRKNMA